MSKAPPLGQHFLADRQVLEELISAIAPARGDRFVEVGPGRGALTRPLLEAGAHVRAIEIDRRLAGRLPERMGDLAERLEVVCADAARQLPVPEEGAWRLAGNIPYSISSPLLFLLAQSRERLADCTVMVQREFAGRLAAAPDGRDYGRLSVAVQARFEVEELFAVPAAAFSPPPRVDSAVVRLRPRIRVPEVVDRASFDSVVRLAFAKRRKQLGNALAGVDCGLDPRLAALRAENLGVVDYIRLAENLERRQCPGA